MTSRSPTHFSNDVAYVEASKESDANEATARVSAEAEFINVNPTSAHLGIAQTRPTSSRTTMRVNPTRYKL